jgi:anti-sigma regulatory factor (Ser/Thr protein kinase)
VTTSAEDARVLTQFELPSEPGNERQVIARVEQAVTGLALPPARLEKLKTAVAEATMNAIEHGNQNVAERPVSVRVLHSPGLLRVLVADMGSEPDEPPAAEVPDIEAKLAGLQKPRGWGLFLIRSMVDEARVTNDARGHTLELALHLEGDSDEQ